MKTLDTLKSPGLDRLKGAGFFLIAAIFVMMARPAFAETIEDRMERLESQNKELREKYDKLESDKTGSGTFTPEDKKTFDLMKALYERVQPFGDIRIRYDGEHYLTQDTVSHGVNFNGISTNFAQFQARVRFGLQGQIVDGLRYQVRLGTGSTTAPASAHATWNNFFNKSGINLDRYWLDWQPMLVYARPWQTIIGKFQNPIQGTELIWDEDVGITGIYSVFDFAKLWNSKVFKRLALGGMFYYLSNLTPDGADDVFAIGPTLQSTLAISPQFNFVSNLSYYDFHNADGIALAIATGALTTAQGGTFTSNLTPIGPVNVGAATAGTLSNLGFASDYNLINPYFEVNGNLFDVPGKVWCDLVWNAGASGPGKNRNFGTRTGVKFGGTGKPGSPYLSYEFFWIEADATLDAFNEDQIGTNDTGHIIKPGITLAKNVDLTVQTNFHQDIDGGLRGFGDTLGTKFTGITVPIETRPWMLRSRVELTVKF